MVAEFPALPFFTDAYLADTRHLTTEEHGAYLLLLMCAWRTRGCALRDDDRMLARIAGVSAGRWRRLRAVLIEFFTVEDGYWRQKKLSQVYGAVAKKVERNRANGAKGGRANALKQKKDSRATAGFSPGWQPVLTAGICSGEGASDSASDRLATKTRLQNQTGSRAPDGLAETQTPPASADIKAIAAAAALDNAMVDYSVVSYWLASGADVAADILPAIERIRRREMDRTGQPPFHLAYYSAAILEARNKRVGASVSGATFRQQHPGRPGRIDFDNGNIEHWQRFLGDADNKFRGVYLSSHWCIPADHPVFKAADLGPDPCHRFNAKIPVEIYKQYGGAWGWRPHDGSDGVRHHASQRQQPYTNRAEKPADNPLSPAAKG